MKDFVHLHVHSEYSLLDGLTKFDKLMPRLKELNMSAVALTDHGSMFGAIKFYNKAKAAGIKPIIGVETYIAKRSRFDKDPKLDHDQYHLILLAKSEKGYKNLLRIVTASHLEGYYYKPRTDFELLKQYSEDVIALSGCLSGIGQSHWKKGEDEQAEKGMLKLYEIFGDNFYAEIQRHKSLKELDIVNPKLIAFAKKYGIPLVATADAHYLTKDDAEAQEILLCIQTQKTIDDPNRGLSMISEPNFYIKSAEEMYELYADIPEACENTVKIAEQVNIELDIGKLIFPKFPLPEGSTAGEYLRKLAFERMPNRYDVITDVLKQRLDYEIKIIEDKGYPTYFLIVADFTNWAKQQGIGVGPGRGSAAGSLMAYVMGITDLDPMAHNLPFERFLNPERASPPDIDMDFADDRREEVILYVTQKYGDDHVAQIVTFGTMEARAAVRDCGRALGYSYADCDRIAKMIPVGAQGSHMTFEKALELSPELKFAYDNEPQTKRLVDLSTKLSGVARHASVHAAGVVIGDKPIVEYTPLMRESKGDKIVTQYDMYSLDLNVGDDAVGLMKMDFLGLRNLTILQKAIKYVEEEQGVKVDLLKVGLTDPKVYELIASGNTTGIFQIESPGMRRLIRDLKPTVFSDISAILALYRPGPMDLIPSFIEGKKDPNTIVYLHPDLKPILEETYGVIVYQEQCMEIAMRFAGYTAGTADLLRRAIGKKKKELMEVEKKKFIEGAQKQGYSEKEAVDVFEYIEKFASYGFNKAHTASYALITYQTGYMKAHYPVEYMAAVLTAETLSKSGSAASKEERTTDIIDECKRVGVAVLPPDINKSYAIFKIETDTSTQSARHPELVSGSPELSAKAGENNAEILKQVQNDANETNGARVDAQGMQGNCITKPEEKPQRNIRFALCAVKNVGEGVVDVICEEREKNGEYLSFYDFIRRTKGEKVNRKVLESLIKAGAFSKFGNRKALLFAMDIALEKLAKEKKVTSKNQAALFDTEVLVSVEQDELVVPEDIVEFSQLELLRLEKELLGFYYSDIALFADFKEAEKMLTHKISELLYDEEVGQNVISAGLVMSVRKIVTKGKGEEMAFVKIEDETGEIEGVVFPRSYAACREVLIPNQPIILCGKLDKRNDEFSLIIDHAEHPEHASRIEIAADAIAKGHAQMDAQRAKWATKTATQTESDTVIKHTPLELFIKRGTTREQLEQVNQVLKKYGGTKKLTIVLENKNALKRIAYPTPVEITPDLQSELEAILGGKFLQLA